MPIGPKTTSLRFPKAPFSVGRGTTWAVIKIRVCRNLAPTARAPHMASLEMAFYPDNGEFPKAYAGDGFAAEHGSWNRDKRTGYEVIRIPLHDGKADGSYEDFLTGFVIDDTSVWGRPVGVAFGQDGSLFVTDDGSRSV